MKFLPRALQSTPALPSKMPSGPKKRDRGWGRDDPGGGVVEGSGCGP